MAAYAKAEKHMKDLWDTYNVNRMLRVEGGSWEQKYEKEYKNLKLDQYTMSDEGEPLDMDESTVPTNAKAKIADKKLKDK